MVYTEYTLVLVQTNIIGQILQRRMAGESSEVNLQHIWLQSGIAEQAVPCCKPTYQMRKLRNKGAILVLVWNFLLANVSHYLVVSVYKPAGTIVVTIGTVTLGITLPFAGWLADVYLGRYKVIRWSIHVDHVGWLHAGYIGFCSGSINRQLLYHLQKNLNCDVYHHGYQFWRMIKPI